MPEIVPELREEIRDVLAESGGIFTSAALQKMKKMDSFLRETSRHNPPGFGEFSSFAVPLTWFLSSSISPLTRPAASFSRKVLKSFTLSSGQVIPAGAIIETPAIAINNDPSLHPDNEAFDPLRFYRPRADAAAEGSGKKSAAAGAANQFVSVNQGHLTFGLGRHACPGRFFAANEIKMILANAVMRFDVTNLEGVEGRIPNLEFGAMVGLSPLFPDCYDGVLILLTFWAVDPGWVQDVVVPEGGRVSGLGGCWRGRRGGGGGWTLLRGACGKWCRAWPSKKCSRGRPGGGPQVEVNLPFLAGDPWCCPQYVYLLKYMLLLE